jgi:AcrR family transcriptional regulator
MVARLLQAVTQCYGNHLVSGPPTVEEVIDVAKVSRATFYKYFNSVDEAIEQRAIELVDEMIDSLKTWAAFVARSDLLRTDGILINGLDFHLANAIDDSDLFFADQEAARILAIGTLRETIRSISRDERSRRGLVDEITKMILVGLGAERAVANQLVRDATIFIRGAAPDRLPWWRDPWSVNAEL